MNKEFKINFREALSIAERVKSDLGQWCSKIEIVGCIRRKRPFVSNIEIVCIPAKLSSGLFEERLTISPKFVSAINSWHCVKGNAFGKHTRRLLPYGMEVDIFMANEDNWGLILAMKTGSAEYSHKVLAKGWRAKGYNRVEGYLVKDGLKVPINEESDLFELIGIPMPIPEKREI